MRDFPIRVLSLFVFFVLFLGCKDSNVENGNLDVLPKVVSSEIIDGVYVVSNELRVATNTALLREVVKTGGELLHEAAGVTLKRSKESPNIRVVLSRGLKLNLEGYRLQVSEDGIVIEVKDKKGVLYAFQTLVQLMTMDETGQISIPCVNIVDYPKYEYRCLDVDVCRHFYSIEDLRRIIKVMSHIKMNKLVLELSDNGGWRVEIKSYPDLTNIGAWRSSIGFSKNQKLGLNKDDGSRYGGYYKQSELRELVRYAKKLNVEIIPKVEVSNHIKAASMAYPFLSCIDRDSLSGKNMEVNHPVCMGNPKVFEFWDAVFTELGHIFDSPYIHVGGGYMPAVYEQLCDKCHSHMEEEHFKTTEELQDHFMADIEKIIYKQGKRLLGWNKVYRYSTNPKSMAMVWESTGAGKLNVLKHHPVIICPHRKYSFQLAQNLKGLPSRRKGVVTLRDVYEFDPNLNEKKRRSASKYVKGVSGIMWTGSSPTFDIACYRMFPRLFAIAESGWTGYGNKDWNNFNARQKNLIPYLEKNEIHFSQLAHKVDFRTISVGKSQFALTLSTDAGAPIRYTLDGAEPTIESTLYTKPIPIKGKRMLKAAAFYPDGSMAKVYGKQIHEHKGLMAKTSFRYMYSSDQGVFRPDVLVDGIRNDFQTIELENMDVTLDLGKVVDVYRINTDWLVRPNRSVFEPRSVRYMVSEDGETYKMIFQEGFPIENKTNSVRSVDCFPGGMKMRYIRVVAKNRRLNPEWHQFPNRYSWLFLDEIVIE
ncbi:family 20 glycosylhydrolase [Prolixibacteraceae bacterium]|nr:family 20 glycosylhydrolase [Prolixibacteraceae bacterium]